MLLMKNAKNGFFFFFCLIVTQKSNLRHWAPVIDAQVLFSPFQRHCNQMDRSLVMVQGIKICARWLRSPFADVGRL